MRGWCERSGDDGEGASWLRAVHAVKQEGRACMGLRASSLPTSTAMERAKQLWQARPSLSVELENKVSEGRRSGVSSTMLCRH